MLIDYIKQNCKDINKLYYVSDGCGGQYKNFKNFLNLCFHKEDYGIEAEWIFFATSHGKCFCDGIGRLVVLWNAMQLSEAYNDQSYSWRQSSAGAVPGGNETNCVLWHC